MEAVEPIKTTTSLSKRVRTRPNILFGSGDTEGCSNMIKRIIDYFVQSYQLGEGASTISLTKFDGIYFLEADVFVPIEYNAAARAWDWEAEFTGMKKRNEDAPYVFGEEARVQRLREVLNHRNYIDTMGLFYAAACSSAAQVTVWGQGEELCFSFVKGEFKGARFLPCAPEVQKTRVRFVPDTAVFNSTDVAFSEITDYVRGQCVVNPGLNIVTRGMVSSEDGETVSIDEHNFQYLSLGDRLQEITKNNDYPIFEISREFHIPPKGWRDAYNFKITLALKRTPDVCMMELYHNYAYLSHGGVLRAAAEEVMDETGESFSIIVHTNSRDYSMHDRAYPHTAINNPDIERELKTMLLELVSSCEEEGGAE